MRQTPYQFQPRGAKTEPACRVSPPGGSRIYARDRGEIEFFSIPDRRIRCDTTREDEDER